ncbi:hypothetical protein [Bradyrhizobium sp. WSM2254]|uniref:hypothetical protein n=1 Tax=Bradyrhizobium sp. WSM2254 TaxID=1188263 RepID=UPI0004014D9A|nr:hypothetical protein [Bradyrhizobium sp. WSM2254]
MFDRFRVVTLALPSRDHLDALLLAIIADLARAAAPAPAGLPLDGDKHARDQDQLAGWILIKTFWRPSAI